MFIIRTTIWLMREIGEATVLSLVLLFVALGSTLHGLDSVIRDFELGWLGPLMAVGVLSGWALARQRIYGWRAGLIIFILGTVAIIFRLGRCGGTLLAISEHLLDLGNALFSESSLDLAPLLTQLNQLGADLNTLFLRLTHWLGGLADGQPIYDPVATTFVWSLTLWTAAVWAGWWVRRRRRPLLALLPAGGLLASVLAHSRENTTPLLIFLAALLMLIALIRQQAREQRWEAHHVGFSPELRTDLTMAIIPLSLALILIAALPPALPFRLPFRRRLGGNAFL